MPEAPWLSQRSASMWVFGLGGICVLLGGAVLAGWAGDVTWLKRVAPAWSSMKVNTALCILLGGAGLVSLAAAEHGVGWARQLARVFGLAIAAITLLVLAEYGFGIDLGVDELFARDTEPGPGSLPGRTSVWSAGCLLLLGVALMTPQATSRRLELTFQLLCSAGLVLGYLAMVGYLFGMRLLVTPAPATSISVHATAAVLLLFAGALLTRPDRGWVAQALRPGSVGLMTRIMLPMLVLLPLLLGWMALKANRADILGTGGAVALPVAATAVLMTAAALLIAARAARLDDALRLQQRTYSTLLANNLDAFVMIDEEGRVVEWNPQAERTFGWERSEVLLRRLDELIIPHAERAAHRAGLLRFLDTRVGPLLLTRKVLTGLRRDGETFPLELVVVPVQLEERWRFGGFLRDLSEQLATEEQLRQAQKMEAVGQLTGGVAHDVNNMLTVVMGSLEILHGRASAGSGELITTARAAAGRCAALVQRLLAFARRQALAPEHIDLGALVSNMRELMVRSLGEQIEIEITIPDGLSPVYADPGQVENALLNLALNARDAMAGQGRLTINMANATLDAAYAARNEEVEAGDYVMLAVSDSGHGMSAEVARRAVDPFFTTKQAGAGTGLGLSMVYGFAKQSQGHLKIYSEPGEGTTIRLYLPRAAPGDVASRREARARSADLSGHGELILVVEDDASVRSFVVGLLQNMGYRVVAAVDGLEALDVLAGEPDVVVIFTDVILPGGMSGRGLADAAQRLRPDVAVLFTSGYTEDAIVHQGRLDPDVAFIAKPYESSDLGARLRDILDAG